MQAAKLKRPCRSGSLCPGFPIAPSLCTRASAGPAVEFAARLLRGRTCLPQALLLRINRVFRLLEELLLKARTYRIRFDRSNRISKIGSHRFHVKFAQLFSCSRTISGIMIRELRVPPDARINAGREILAIQVSTRFTRRPVLMNPGPGAKPWYAPSPTRRHANRFCSLAQAARADIRRANKRTQHSRAAKPFAIAQSREAGLLLPP